MKKFTVYSLQLTVLIAVFLLLLLFPTPYTLHPTLAQTQTCTTDGTSIATGLISTPDLARDLVTGSGAACVVTPMAGFFPNTIPSFASLKSLYYDQGRQLGPVTRNPPPAGDKTQTNISGSTCADILYYINGNLDIKGVLEGNKTKVVFVENNLNIGPITGNQLTYGNDNTGLVFIVKGNVNIHKDITQIDAIIISEGIICTASDNSATPSICPATNIDAPQLVINGSLISLKDADSIKFRRKLFDNSNPAEKINHQVKYLVLLRHLLSDTFQRWSEIDASIPMPALPPGSTPVSVPPAPVFVSRADACSEPCSQDASGNWVRRSYPDAATCGLSFCDYPLRTICPTDQCHGVILGYTGDSCTPNQPIGCDSNSSAYGNQIQICGTRTGTSPNFYDSRGCKQSGGEIDATVPAFTNVLGSYLTGVSCTASDTCKPNPPHNANCPSGCHGSSTGFSGIDCTGTTTCFSNVSSYQQTPLNACGTNHYDQACVNGSFPSNVSWNPTATPPRRQYYDGGTTTTSCSQSLCPLPWSDVAGGEHDTVCGAADSTNTHDSNGCDNTDNANVTGSPKLYWPGSACTRSRCNPNPDRGGCTTAENNSCHGDIYGFDGNTNPAVRALCTKVLKCASNASNYSSTYSQSNVCGTTNNSSACDPLTSAQSSAGLSPVAATGGNLRQYYSDSACTKATCPYPYSSAPGQQSSVCGTPRTGTSPNFNDPRGCKQPDGVADAIAPSTSNVLGRYYPGNSCSQSTCYPNPVIVCPTTGCYGSSAGFNGRNCGTTDPAVCPGSFSFDIYPNKDTACGTLISHYADACTQTIPATPPGSNITFDTSVTPKVRKYYTGEALANSCTTRPCPLPWSDITGGANNGPGGQHDTICGAQVDSTHDNSGCTEPGGSLKTYYTGSSCNPAGGTCKPNPATVRTQTNCPDNTCHDAVYGHNGVTTGTTICARTLICAANYTSNPGYTASNQAAICGTNTSGAIDNHLACLTGTGITMNPSASPGPRRMYADGSSCAINQTCGTPNNQQTSICGNRSTNTITVNNQPVTVTNDSTGCMGIAPDTAAPAPDLNRNKYYPGNSCSQSYCLPNVQSPIPTGCHGAGSDGWSGINCTSLATWESTVASYQQTPLNACGTNHYDQACVNGSFPSNVSWNPTATPPRRQYYDGGTTTTSCSQSPCPLPWSDITGGEHNSVCGSAADATHDSNGCDNTDNANVTGSPKLYWPGSACTRSRCNPNPDRGGCTTAENNSCHGDIYGFDGNTNPAVRALCTKVLKCASNASNYSSTYSQSNVCGTTNNSSACDPLTSAQSSAGLSPVAATGGNLRQYYSDSACTKATCPYPYSPSGNHNDICGITCLNCTVDANTSYEATGTWDDPAKACYSYLTYQCNSYCNYYDEYGQGYDCYTDCYPVTISTRNSYYQGNSCSQNGTCNWPKPISCTALDAAGCHGAVSGYNGQACYFYKTCLSNAASYANQSDVCGTNNSNPCDANGNRKTYYKGTVTNETCSTDLCPYQTATSCPAGTKKGCTADCSAAGSGGCGSQAYHTTTSSCTVNNEACSNTSNKLDICPNTSGTYTCYDTADKFYHEANTCSGTLCPHNYPANNSASAPTCRTTAFNYYNGSSCTAETTTYPINCTTFCDSSNTKCYVRSNLRVVCTPQNGGARNFIDTWYNYSTNQYETTTDGWFQEYDNICSNGTCGYGGPDYGGASCGVGGNPVLGQEVWCALSASLTYANAFNQRTVGGIDRTLPTISGHCGTGNTYYSINNNGSVTF